MLFSFFYVITVLLRLNTMYNAFISELSSINAIRHTLCFTTFSFYFGVVFRGMDFILTGRVCLT